MSAARCINEGCTPTKTMVASARVAYLARRGADYGVQTGPISVDMSKVRQRKRDIVDELPQRQRAAHRPARQGVDLLMGEARFIGAQDGRSAPERRAARAASRADLIFINTGAPAQRRPTWPGWTACRR